MQEQEGVIKFQLRFTEGHAPKAEQTIQLSAWRKLCYLTKLIGQEPERYEGYGFGNISERIGRGEEAHQRPFLISGTQTGFLESLEPHHYAFVRECYPEKNLVIADGPLKPSSESMTHGTLYALDERIRFVIHVHSPDLWQNAPVLNIPTTAADVPYGTPAMGAEVARLFAETDVREQGIFSMGGHEDGIVTFGETAEAAGSVLFTYLAQAWQVAALTQRAV